MFVESVWGVGEKAVRVCFALGGTSVPIETVLVILVIAKEEEGISRLGVRHAHTHVGVYVDGCTHTHSSSSSTMQSQVSLLTTPSPHTHTHIAQHTGNPLAATIGVQVVVQVCSAGRW